MSSIVTKIMFSVVLGAVGAIAAYFLTNNQNRAHENANQQGPTRRRRPSPPARSRNWNEDSDDDDHTDYRSLALDDSSTLVGRRKTDNQQHDASICGICLDKLEDAKKLGREIHATMCGHLFCRRCIRQALRRNPICPICRDSCEPDSTHVVYI